MVYARGDDGLSTLYETHQWRKYLKAVGAQPLHRLSDQDIEHVRKLTTHTQYRVRRLAREIMVLIDIE